MNRRSKVISGQKSGKDFSRSERCKIIDEYLSSGSTKKAIWEKYTGQPAENGQLLVWMKQLGYISKSSEVKQKVLTKYPTAFSIAERRSIIEEYLSSGCSKQEIWEKYTGQKEEHGRLLRWMRQLGYSTEKIQRRPNFVPMKAKITRDLIDESFENLQLKKRISELENQLKDAEMKAIAFSTMVDIAEKEFNIPIRKKYNTKPSKK